MVSDYHQGIIASLGVMSIGAIGAIVGVIRWPETWFVGVLAFVAFVGVGFGMLALNEPKEVNSSSPETFEV
jgi:hypothetical protein